MSKKLSALQNLKNEKGMAILEAVPLLVIFVVLISFGLGYYGIIQTAILHSIGARTYAFETFRNRTNLYVFRENGTGLQPGRALEYTRKGWRYHAVTNVEGPIDKFVSSPRPIALGRGVAAADANESTHNQQIFNLLPRNERIAVNPVWVMVGYGICMNASCGK